MSFLSERRSLRSGKRYSQILHLVTSVKTENTEDASETRGAEEVDKSINRISPELIEERIRANLKPP